MIHLIEESARCLLCSSAPCGETAAHAVRAVRFDNIYTARKEFAKLSEEELLAAERTCIHYDRPIRLLEMAKTVESDSHGTFYNESKAPDLSALTIDFCGIHCENPFFLASSAVCTNYEMVARAFDMGWAGVFYKTICLQDINEVSPRFDAVQQNGTSDFFAFRNMEQLSENPVEMDFDILHRLKQNYPSKVVVASIMGQTEEEWIELAKMAEYAGVDAIELNFSCPQMRLAGMGSDVGQNPELVLFYTAYVKRNVSIPVIPKMTPNITHINEPAMAAYFANADAISAINTIKSVTMTERAEVNNNLTISELSGRAVKPIALRFILEMAKNPVLNGTNTHGKAIELSGIGGIETWRDALEFIQLGCRNVQVCTAVMQYGYRIIDDLTQGLAAYLAERGISNIADIVGEELPRFVTPTDLDRQTIVYPNIDRSRCIGCGRCYTSCMDGGHQAIKFDASASLKEDGRELRQPRIVGTKCVGCHLCRLVCPTGAMGTTKRINKKL